MPHKNIVKYLGVNLDVLMRLSKHINIQLDKAKKAFKANSKLFFSKSLNPRAKVICYMLLIRLILTYAAPVWFYFSASTAEKLRGFERSCLRASLNLYRTPNSNYTRYYSNHVLYNTANIPRIDNFILNIIRGFWSSANLINHDDVKKNSIITDTEALDQCKRGYTTPACFLFLDKNGIMQNENNIPELYHVSRHANNKKILHPLLGNAEQSFIKYKYSRIVSDSDLKDNSRFINKSYWWLNQSGDISDDIRRRARRKNGENQSV